LGELTNLKEARIKRLGAKDQGTKEFDAQKEKTRNLKCKDLKL